MTKKMYEKPMAEIINFDFEDMITASSESCNPGHGHGHGHGNAWGYDNGNHYGHGKGHNPHDNP